MFRLENMLEKIFRLRKCSEKIFTKRGPAYSARKTVVHPICKPRSWMEPSVATKLKV